MIFSITAAFHRVTDITPGVLERMGVRGLILDIDNTLTTHDHPVPAEGVEEWLSSTREHGISAVIVSNNHEPRVKPFADLLGLDYVCEGAKPLKKGYAAAAEKLGLPKEQIAAVGDQIFTDVAGANIYGIKMLFVEPIEKEPKKQRFIRFKRVLEKPFLPRKVYRRNPEKERKL